MPDVMLSYDDDDQETARNNELVTPEMDGCMHVNQLISRRPVTSNVHNVAIVRRVR